MSKRVKKAVEVRPQRYSWKAVATYDDHASALADKDHREQTGQRVKIKLRAERFEVRVGTKIKKAAEPETPVE
jgi:hypothetical protein